MPPTRRIPEAVLLLTDIVESTRLTGALGEEAVERLWREHDLAARTLMARWRGLEVDRTDGFLLLFQAVNDAVGFARDFHRALRALSERLGVAVRARAGVHLGPVLLLENSDEDRARGAKAMELEGLSKPVAARIMSIARGGQTLLSAPAMERLTLTGLRTRSHGSWQMKGLAEPVELFGVLEPDGSFEPPEESDKVWRVSLGPEGWRPLRETPGQLPPERDAFVGREAELRALFEALEAGARVLTLLGPGGVGKTRLAVHFGRLWHGDWPGGVWFCDLSEARDPDQLARGIAGALGVPLGREAPEVQLGNVLAARGRALLILDGVEYLAEPLSALLDRWVDRAPRARFLLSSRARLSARGERVLPLDPLPEGPGAELFLARARAHSPGLDFDAQALEDIRVIVRLVDGLPLALELAAARARVLSPARLRQRLSDRFGMLVGGRASARQSTLRATIDWSWELLDLPARAALAGLSVFEGGFTLEAAEAVLDLSPLPGAPEPWEVLELLEAHSLIRPLGAQPGRFGMLEVIRAYAAERLDGSPDLPPSQSGPDARRGAEARHGAWCASLFDKDARLRLHGPDGLALRRRLSVELANLEAACTRAVARGDGPQAARLLDAVWSVFGFRGPFQRGVALGEAVAALALSPADRLSVLRTCANARLQAGRLDLALDELRATEALARTLDDPAALSGVLGDLGVALSFVGSIDEGTALLKEGLEIARRVGLRRELSAHLVRLGNIAFELGDITSAERQYREALPLSVAIGDRAMEGILCANLTRVLVEHDRLDEAESACERALRIAREIEAPKSEAFALSNLGNLRSWQGRYAESEAAFRAALAVHRATGNRVEEGVNLLKLADLLLRRAELAQAGAIVDTALEIAREAQSPRLELLGRAAQARVQLQRGEPRAALREAEEAEDIGRRARLDGELLEVCCLQVEIGVQLGELRRAREALSRAERVATGLGAGLASLSVRELARARDRLRDARIDDDGALPLAGEPAPQETS